MANLIVLEEKPICAKGLNIQNKVDYTRLKQYFFDSDYKSLKLLQKMSSVALHTESPCLLYPGCGADIFYPLLYCERLFTASRFTFEFVDLHDNLGLILTQLQDVGIDLQIQNRIISFYWNQRLIELKLRVEDINNCLGSLEYDIYFERAFRIMRDHIPHYEERVLDRLKPKGVLISDSGFAMTNLEKIKIPLELSSYHEMIMGIKKGNL